MIIQAAEILKPVKQIQTQRTSNVTESVVKVHGQFQLIQRLKKKEMRVFYRGLLRVLSTNRCGHSFF